MQEFILYIMKQHERRYLLPHKELNKKADFINRILGIKFFIIILNYPKTM